MKGRKGKTESNPKHKLEVVPQQTPREVFQSTSWKGKERKTMEVHKPMLEVQPQQKPRMVFQLIPLEICYHCQMSGIRRETVQYY